MAEKGKKAAEQKQEQKGAERVGGAELELDGIYAMLDDGTPRECECCVLSEGRKPKYIPPSLTENVMEIAWPLLEGLERAPVRLWLELFRGAARAWNVAVARALGATVPTLGEPEVLVEVLAERKRQLFPDDFREVAEVRLTGIGDGMADLWCKPVPRAANDLAKALRRAPALG